MTKYLTSMDVSVLEVHFARDNAVFARFSVTLPGWHNIWMLSKYGGAYAKDSECMVRSEAIAWARYLDTTQWYEIDNENLIPLRSAHKSSVINVVNHLNHAPTHGDDDQCGVTARKIDGFGWVYRVSDDDEEEEDPDKDLDIKLYPQQRYAEPMIPDDGDK